MGRAALVVLLLAAVACGSDDPEVSDDLERQVTELEEDVADLGEQLDQAEARREQEEWDEYWECREDPTTPTGAFGLPDCDGPSTGVPETTP